MPGPAGKGNEMGLERFRNTEPRICRSQQPSPGKYPQHPRRCRFQGKSFSFQSWSFKFQTKPPRTPRKYRGHGMAGFVSGRLCRGTARLAYALCFSDDSFDSFVFHQAIQYPRLRPLQGTGIRAEHCGDLRESRDGGYPGFWIGCAQRYGLQPVF